MTEPVPDLQDVNAVLHYGVQAQTQVAEFTEIVLKNLSESETEETGIRLEVLLARLKEPMGEEISDGRFSLVSRLRNLRRRRIREEIDRIALSLQRQRDLLLRDVEILEQLFQMNREQYNALTECLERGREALDRFRLRVLVPRTEEARLNASPLAVQAVREAEEQYERFEKKLHDLELTRAVSLQMAPQIRLLQNNDSVLAEKIQTAVTNAVPLWKSQMVLALSAERARKASGLQQKIGEVTNALLLQNARRQRETVRSVMQVTSRGCTDGETLKQTGTLLLETVEEMVKLREEGRELRARTESELHRLDRDIRLRLLPAELRNKK